MIFEVNHKEQKTPYGEKCSQLDVRVLYCIIATAACVGRTIKINAPYQSFSIGNYHNDPWIYNKFIRIHSFGWSRSWLIAIISWTIKCPRVLLWCYATEARVDKARTLQIWVIQLKLNRSGSYWLDDNGEIDTGINALLCSTSTFSSVSLRKLLILGWSK